MNLFSPKRGHRRLFELNDATDDLVLRLDNTALQLIQYCPTAAYNELILGRTSANRAPLDYGGALHRALEVWQLTSDVDAAKDALIKYWDTIPKYDMGWRTLEQAYETFLAYVDHYKHPFKLYEHNGTTMLEQSFDIELETLEESYIFRTFPRHLLLNDLRAHPTDDPTECYLHAHRIQLRWTGRIDLLALDGLTPRLVDHKTCSVDSTSFWDSHYNAAQFSGYIYALRQLGIDNVRDVMVNALITRKPTATGTAIDFARQVYPRYDWHLTEWKEDVLACVTSFLTQLSRGSFTRHTGNCAGKFGRCHFFDACLAPPTNREHTLSSDLYAERTWSPLN